MPPPPAVFLATNAPFLVNVNASLRGAFVRSAVDSGTELSVLAVSFLGSEVLFDFGELVGSTNLFAVAVIDALLCRPLFSKWA